MKRSGRAAYHRQWRLANPGKVKAAAKRRYWDNKGKLCKKYKEWIKRNPLKGWKYSREYYLKHRKKILARKKAWYREHKHRLKVKRVLGG